MATLSEIRSQDWQLSTQAQGGIVQGLDDIKQCIDIILSTAQGTDPFRPDFGIDLMAYLDLPVNVAAPNLIREITEQIELWETRVTITAISYQVQGSTLEFSVSWESNRGTGTNTATFTA